MLDNDKPLFIARAEAPSTSFPPASASARTFPSIVRRRGASCSANFQMKRSPNASAENPFIREHTSHIVDQPGVAGRNPGRAKTRLRNQRRRTGTGHAGACRARVRRKPRDRRRDQRQRRIGARSRRRPAASFSASAAILLEDVEHVGAYPPGLAVTSDDPLRDRWRKRPAEDGAERVRNRDAGVTDLGSE